jgi:hypothetical protein
MLSFKYAIIGASAGAEADVGAQSSQVLAVALALDASLSSHLARRPWGMRLLLVL